MKINPFLLVLMTIISNVAMVLVVYAIMTTQTSAIVEQLLTFQGRAAACPK